MTELSAEISLRPTRIGFLTRPTDVAAVRQIMSSSACLWGGLYNPIIPVFRKPPTEWKGDHRTMSGRAAAVGYIRFFEPDVYVESRNGLLEEAGSAALRERPAFHSAVCELKDLLSAERGRTWAEPAYGLSIHDVLNHIYENEQQFLHREKREALLIRAERGSALTEVVFGLYPSARETEYIRNSYVDVYQPETVAPTPDTWRRVFLNGAVTPLKVTRYGLNLERYWHHDPVLFVFDPKRAPDLIDAWNVRLEPHPVLPIPIEWFEELSDDIREILRLEHRPVAGNPHGVRHNATIEFARSISKQVSEELLRALGRDLPEGSLVVKPWRNPIWVEHRDTRVHRDRRMKISAREQHASLPLENDSKLRTSFPTLAPEFAEKFGTSHHRWANVLRLANYSTKQIATILPFNTFDRRWPKLAMTGNNVSIGSDGWVFTQQYQHWDQPLYLLNSTDAIVGALKQLNVDAKLSEPGHIAKQMLEHLGGLRDVYLLADVRTLALLNKMAGGLRRKRDEDETVEETFELRTAPVKEWIDLISLRRAKQSLPRLSVEDFTRRNVIRIGLETSCPHCVVTNWHSLSAVDYMITCERCLKLYDFPQASLRQKNQNFAYRVFGPFSVPDFGRGSYSALLALRAIDTLRMGFSTLTYSTAMTLSFGGIQREVDFVAWRGADNSDAVAPPQLILGETKSMGSGELITARDLTKLKSVAEHVPDAVIVIAVLRDHFTSTEKDLLTRFVKWGYRAIQNGRPSNPVVLLTSHELTMHFDLISTWKELSEPHARFADYKHTRDLFALADATNQLYLGLPSFAQESAERWRRRHARRTTAKRGNAGS